MTRKAAQDSQAERSRPSPLARIQRRLDGDFNLALMALFATPACLALFPFFIYRAANGDVSAAIGNGALLLVILLTFGYAWKTGRTAGALKTIAISIALGCSYMVAYVGHPAYWVFPTLVANFMLVGWRFALVVNSAMVMAVLIGAPLFSEPIETFSFLAAVILVSVFSMFFVIHTNFHRDRLNEMVEQDALTGALNRRALAGPLEQALLGTVRFGQLHALAVMDLDDFKQINDLYGHETGDRVLVDFARRVMRDVRRGDLFYRLGGEEFVLLLSHTDREGAEIALNKLHVDVRESLDMEDGPVTVSIGVAISRPNETWTEWLARADQAMYRAKDEGKDRVIFDD